MSRRDRKRGKSVRGSQRSFTCRVRLSPRARRFCSKGHRFEPGHNGLGGRLTPFFHATADPCVDAPRKERADIAGDITKAAPG
jgi:hypothetical protein